MRIKIVLAALCALISFFSSLAPAQSSADPSDAFLNAYTTFQKAEKQEAAGNFQGALQGYREAAQLLDQIAQRSPNWNPSIIDFRRKRTAEAITKVQSRITQGGGAVPEPGAVIPGFPPPSNEPPLPGDGNVILPDELPAAPKSTGPRTRGTTPRGGTPLDPIQEIQDRMERLRQESVSLNEELSKVKADRDRLSKEKEAAEKGRIDAEEKQKLLLRRADLAEKALNDARNRDASDSEAIQVLQTQRDKLRRELRDLAIEREAAEEVREQIASRLAITQKRAESLKNERDAAVSTSKTATAEASKSQNAVEARVAAAEKKADAAIADAAKRVEAALKERDELGTKLALVIKERDDARQQVTKLKEAQKQVDNLMTENSRLMAKLTEAEKQIVEFKAEGERKDVAIADLKKEVGNVKKQLADTQKQSATYQTQMADLQAKLESTGKELTVLKTDSAATVVEKKKMTEENELLRGIIYRQMKAEARQAITRKEVLDSLAKLDVKSKDLLKKIDLLGQKTLILTDKERKLFKKPQVDIADNEIAMVSPSNAAPAPAEPKEQPLPEPALPALAPPVAPAPEPVKVAKLEEPKTPPPPAPAPAPAPEPAPAPPKALSLDITGGEPALDLSLPPPPAPTTAPTPVKTEEKPPADQPTASAETPAGGSGRGEATTMAAMSRDVSKLPPDLMAFVQEGKEQYERGNFREAEKAYERVLLKAPSNLYALSNLGVVRFRAGKLKLAEEAFKKAIAIAPEDSFSHCKLGAVYYSQARYDEAVNELTKALAIDPKDSVAHNYLGITASQKGWPEAAQKELEAAVALDPNNADAHFNLAVVFATQQPPNKERAREHYKKAVELGAEADSSLEALIK